MALATVVAGACGFAAIGTPVLAQSWWPFGNDEPRRPPVPREPVFRPDAVPAPIPEELPPPQQEYDRGPQPQSQPQPPPSAGAYPSRNPICLQLEQRLVKDGQGNAQSQLPAIEGQIRENDRIYRQAQQQLDRNCYEYFLFAKTFRNSPSCKNLAMQSDTARRRLSELEAQRQQITSGAGRSYRDEIITELARNGCGANYQEQARRRSSGRDYGFWQDDESQAGPNTWNPFGTNGAQTYRTICVRLCDGYYFPVSFSTLPSHFEQDANVCQQRCAAPSELFYYQNPGGSVDQSVAASTQEPYTTLKTAFRYRKEYVKGCSCKEAEYVPEDGSTPDKRADANGGRPSIGNAWTPPP